MSRIDDDREAARQAERIAEQRRQEDKLRTDKKATDSAFARLVGESQKQQGQIQRQNIHRGHASEADAKFLEKADPSSAERAKEDRERALGRYGVLSTRSGDKKTNVVLRELMETNPKEAESAQAFSESNKQVSKKQLQGQGTWENQEQVKKHSEQAVKLHQSDREFSKAEIREQAEMGKKSVSQTESQQEARSAQSKSDDKKHTEMKSEARSARTEEKAAHMRQASETKRPDKETREDLGSLLRTNPALMEPAPIVRPKQTGDSERLRKIASEIAQKIVERVRVGTNKTGNAEFQIDLRSDVLSGLSLRVSASGGKISVVFSGSDKNTLKTVESQSEALRTALDVRGLTLTHMKFEMTS